MSGLPCDADVRRALRRRFGNSCHVAHTDARADAAGRMHVQIDVSGAKLPDSDSASACAWNHSKEARAGARWNAAAMS